MTMSQRNDEELPGTSPLAPPQTKEGNTAKTLETKGFALVNAPRYPVSESGLQLARLAKRTADIVALRAGLLPYGSRPAPVCRERTLFVKPYRKDNAIVVL